MREFGPGSEVSYHNLFQKISTIYLEEPSSDNARKLQQLLNNNKESLLGLKFEVCTLRANTNNIIIIRNKVPMLEIKS